MNDPKPINRVAAHVTKQDEVIAVKDFRRAAATWQAWQRDFVSKPCHIDDLVDRLMEVRANILAGAERAENVQGCLDVIDRQIADTQTMIITMVNELSEPPRRPKKGEKKRKPLVASFRTKAEFDDLFPIKFVRGIEGFLGLYLNGNYLMADLEVKQSMVGVVRNHAGLDGILDWKDYMLQDKEKNENNPGQPE